MSSHPEHEPMQLSESERRTQWEAGAERRLRIRDGYQANYEPAFTAYLALPDTDLDDPHLLEHFERRYLGSYPDRQAACDAFLRAAGWVYAASEFAVFDPEDHTRLSWDYDRIEAAMRRHTAWGEHEGEIHVFATAG